MVKNLPANAGDVTSIPGSGKIPWRRKWQPTPVFLPGKSHGCSPRGCKRGGHNWATKQQWYGSWHTGAHSHLGKFTAWRCIYRGLTVMEHSVLCPIRFWFKCQLWPLLFFYDLTKVTSTSRSLSCLIYEMGMRVKHTRLFWWVKGITCKMSDSENSICGHKDVVLPWTGVAGCTTFACYA